MAEIAGTNPIAGIAAPGRGGPGQSGAPATQTARDGAGPVQPRGGSSGAAAADGRGADGLTPQEERVVRELRQRDAEVRRHEQAHSAVGGQYAGAPRYDYTTGPDNRRYATSGEVSIDVSPIAGDPQATIAKMRVVRRAALAPAEPSAQDRQVAAQAQAEIARARAEQVQQRREEAAEAAEDRRAEPGTAPGDFTAGLIAAQEARGAEFGQGPGVDRAREGARAYSAASVLATSAAPPRLG